MEAARVFERLSEFRFERLPKKAAGLVPACPQNVSRNPAIRARPDSGDRGRTVPMVLAL